MGSPPPKDYPPPAEQAAVEADAGFAPSPTGSALCGFAIPPSFTFNVSFNFQLPSFDFPPKFFFGLSLNCDLDNPIGASAGFGGGRKSQQDPDPDQIDP
jgi:hypothetical protein